MPRYNYTAINADGKTIKGSISAENPYAARKQLRSRNIHPTTLTETGQEKESRLAFLASLGTGRKARLLDFTKQLATLLNAEIKLTESLSVLIQQIDEVRFKNAIIDIRDRVISGESFTDALSDYGDYFDVIYISMVRVGEVTGSLGVTLSTIAAFMEKRQRVESKLITVMIYPVIVMVFCICAVIFLTIAVMPKVANLIEQTGQKLPTITKVMMGFSYVLTNWWFAIIGVIMLLVMAYKRITATEKGKLMRDKFVLSLPVFGPLIRQRIVSRFASTLSTLLSSGLSMAESLKVVAEVTGNVIMNNAVRQALERILSGADIATPLRESGVLSPAIAHMVSVGEKSGELELMLKRISENLESSTDVVIERLAATIEPLIIIVLVVSVGLIAVATLLPLLQFSSKL